MLPVLVIVLLGLAHGQMHGPGHEHEVMCYDCHGPHGGFPDCMNHHKVCHHDEICQVNYGGNHPEIRCRRRDECQREVDHSTRLCSGGGAEVHGTCQQCCTDDSCVVNAVSSLMNATFQGTAVGLDLHCPADCAIDNLATCITHGHRCLTGQYCKVSVDRHNNHLHGKCEDKDHMHHCEDELYRAHCDPDKCVAGCCTDDACVAGTLGAGNATFWGFLNGACEDQLEGNQCQTLDVSKHLCNDRLALRVCPKACGLCSVFGNSTCKDTVLNNGCANLQATENICSSDIAIDICAQTCNLCDKWIDMKINAALANGQINGITAAPGTTMAPNFACADLVSYDCSVLTTLCPIVSCPNECSRCSSSSGGGSGGNTDASNILPTVATTTKGMDIAGLTCDSIQGMGCGVLDGICPLVDCPDVCNPCFSPIVEVTTTPAMTAPTTTTPAPPMPPTAAPSGGAAMACVDSLEGMDCGSVEDVCSSPLLANYCPKHCGMCS